MNKLNNRTEHSDRRAVIRISCQTPLAYKICKEETISKIMQGYTHDISRDGVRCTFNEKVPIGCTLWLQLDTDALAMCEEIEKNSVILQHGILGKAIWVDKGKDNTYEVGLRFITRQEKTQL